MIIYIKNLILMKLEKLCEKCMKQEKFEMKINLRRH